MLDRSPRRSVSNFRDRVSGGSVNMVVRRSEHQPHMDDESFLSELSTEAFERLESVDSDPLRLPEPWKTIVLVYSAQGVIDNGGFTYFFENDWPNKTPYEEFASAYDRIGKHGAATAIRDAVTVMGLVNAETQIDERREYIEKNGNEHDPTVAGWDDDAIVGDETIMTSLAQWIRTQKSRT